MAPAFLLTHIRQLITTSNCFYRIHRMLSSDFPGCTCSGPYTNPKNLKKISSKEAFKNVVQIRCDMQLKSQYLARRRILCYRASLTSNALNPKAPYPLPEGDRPFKSDLSLCCSVTPIALSPYLQIYCIMCLSSKGNFISNLPSFKTLILIIKYEWFE